MHHNAMGELKKVDSRQHCPKTFNSYGKVQLHHVTFCLIRGKAVE